MGQERFIGVSQLLAFENTADTPAIRFQNETSL